MKYKLIQKENQKWTYIRPDGTMWITEFNNRENAIKKLECMKKYRVKIGDDFYLKYKQALQIAGNETIEQE